MRSTVTVIVLLCATCFCTSAVADEINTATLLYEMTDLKALAEFPASPFTCKQFSSYDRRSTTPDNAEDWFANLDTGQFLRVEERDGRKEYVIMDADGPGAIVRIWSANPRGVLRFYFDGSETPTFEAPMADLLGGKIPGIPAPIACETSRGWSSYLPMPYAKHCKVTGDEIYVEQEDGRAYRVYYHINYRTYDPDTRIATFSTDDLTSDSALIQKYAEALAEPKTAAGPPAAQRGDDTHPTQSATIPPGAAHQWRSQRAGGAIEGLAVRVKADDLDVALRRTLLKIDFDGEPTVICPLGDFFGSAPGLSPYSSLPLGMSDDGLLWSHWFMPFEKNASINFTNYTDADVQLDFRIYETDHAWTKRSMHFHAKWRGQFDVPSRPMIDWNYLTAAGRGVFVGAAFTIANPSRTWWGEGDEKIYVDGESFPSTFGTGTEDYYGYAWGSSEVFHHAYHNQPRCDGPGSYGHTAVNRWHIIDCIPFQTEFRFDMELWHWVEDIDVDMTVVAYWYARPGGKDKFPPITRADLRLEPMPPYVAPRVAGAIEGEEMREIERTGGDLELQGWAGLSNEKHLWWRDGGVGGRIVLGFDVEQAGEYRVFARFLTANDYGRHKLTINEQPAAEPIDLYSPNVRATEDMELGRFKLKAGENRLTVEVVGANERALPRHMFGLDYLRLEPALRE